jgi:hypothetical protein
MVIHSSCVADRVREKSAACRDQACLLKEPMGRGVKSHIGFPVNVGRGGPTRNISYADASL